MKVIDKLPDNLAKTKIAWVLRHAEKLDNLDQLSSSGIEQAQKFARQIKHLPLNAIYSSPTERCIQTAQIILQQYEKDIPFILDNTIGEVGIYVTDMQKALETYHTLGKEEFFRRLLTDEKLEGYNRFSYAGKVISEFIRLNTTEPGITMFITHNFIIRMLNHYIRNLTYKDKLLKVNPLEGIFIQIN